MTGEFEGFLSAALRDSFAEASNATPCILCGQPSGSLHDQEACDAKMAAWQPLGLYRSAAAPGTPCTAAGGGSPACGSPTRSRIDQDGDG
jgi:hypothetical protein